MGLLRASFVPPKPIRDLRDYTRARARLTQERTRCWQRLEKLMVRHEALVRREALGVEGGGRPSRRVVAAARWKLSAA
jgi:hypothetical protein